MKSPLTGGRYIRDKQTGERVRVPEDQPEAAASAVEPEAAAAATETNEPIPADAGAIKKRGK